MTIACFIPTISVGSTLTHVRYYLDDPVHLLVKLNGVVITYAKEPLNKSHANTKRAIDDKSSYTHFSS